MTSKSVPQWCRLAPGSADHQRMALTRSAGASGQRIERPAGPVLHGALAAELAVPDGQLAVEIPETRERHEVDAVGRRRGPHGQERRHDLVMQGAGRVGQLRQVAPGAPSELIQREFRGWSHAWLSYRTPEPAFLRNKSTLRAVSDPANVAAARKAAGKIARK